MARYNVDLQDDKGNAYQTMANPDSVAEFSPAPSRENIKSGETHRVIFGKIMKYLSEVGNAAYVGLANNCTTTVEGFALDARQGKELMDRINELNRDLTYFYGGGNEIDIKSYIRTHITAQNVPSGRSPKSFHLRNDNGDVNLIGSAINIGNDAFTGFFVDFNTGDAYSFKKWGADPVIKKLGSFQRKLLGRVTSSTTFDCKSIPGWEDFTENNFAIIPVKIDATGGQWKSGATGAGGAQQGGCTPTLSYDKVNGILKVSNFSWNNDYAYGSYWTNYCHGNMTADVYCYHF